MIFIRVLRDVMFPIYVDFFLPAFRFKMEVIVYGLLIWVLDKSKKLRKWPLLTLQELQSGSQALSRSSSNISNGDLPRKKAEPAYSFVGMHCIFDQCKAMGNSFEKLN